MVSCPIHDTSLRYRSLRPTYYVLLVVLSHIGCPLYRHLLSMVLGESAYKATVTHIIVARTGVPPSNDSASLDRLKSTL